MVVVVVYSTFLRFKILLFTLHYAAVVSYLYNMASGVWRPILFNYWYYLRGLS